MDDTLPTTLDMFFRDPALPRISLILRGGYDDGLYAVGESEQEVELPNGETILVYAEVAAGELGPDISLSIIQGGRDFDVRCSGGLIVSYTTEQGLDVLCQIGTGGWE